MQTHSTTGNTPTSVATQILNSQNVSPPGSKSKLVRGVGHNDADHPVHTYSWIDGRQKLLWICPFYKTWMDMLDRCYSAKFHERNPTYVGCSVAPVWLSFSAFRSWMLQQDHEGKQLDKDILVKGNKIYSPETCAFTTAKINKFMTDSGASRGEWPIGVSWSNKGGKFVAHCRNPFTGKSEHLGYFTRSSAASEAWRSRKHDHACAYANLQTDQRVAEALRSRYKPKKISQHREPINHAVTATLQEAA